MLLLLPLSMFVGFRPTGLMTNFQKSPALGVTAVPQFTWIVPPCEAAADQAQVSFELSVVRAEGGGGGGAWSSGQVASANSTAVVYTGPALLPGTAYNWTVKTATTSCTSDPSEAATFITAHFNGWSQGAAYIWTKPAPDVGVVEVPASIPAYLGVAGDRPVATATATAALNLAPPDMSSSKFGFFRKVVMLPSGKTVVRATAAITAVTDDVIMCGYKLYIAGKLINVGPGRGEAAIWVSARQPECACALDVHTRSGVRGAEHPTSVALFAPMLICIFICTGLMTTLCIHRAVTAPTPPTRTKCWTCHPRSQQAPPPPAAGEGCLLRCNRSAAPTRAWASDLL